jgi:hypothetical protein
MAKRDPASPSQEIVPTSGIDRGESPVAKAILEFVSRIPESEVPKAAKASVEEECRRMASSAANKAALTAGSLALPPGPLGWLTVLPELVAIWRIQGQLVSDIAAAYGKTAKLGREQMLWCLFRHTAAQAFRDIAIRVGDRLVFRTTATSVLQRLAGRIGVSVTKRAVGKGISRWLPVVGALGVGAYAYYDTGQVAKTAIELFSGDVHIDDGDDTPEKPGKKAKAAATNAPAKTSGPKADATPAGDSQASARPVGARLARDTAPKAPANIAVKKSATRKRATTKKTAPRKTATKKAATTKSAPKKTAKKVARRPATKKATRKTTT